MEKKINELKWSMDLMFAYMERCKYYDRLLEDEGIDRNIISIFYSGENLEKVDVFKLSKIKDPGLRERIPIMDNGIPLAKFYGDRLSIYVYLSDVKKILEESLKKQCYQ